MQIVTKDNVVVEMKKEHNHPPLTETISKEHNLFGKSGMVGGDIPIVTEAICKEKSHQAESGMFGEDISGSSLESVQKEVPVEKSKFMFYWITLVL